MIKKSFLREEYDPFSDMIAVSDTEWREGLYTDGKGSFYKAPTSGTTKWIKHNGLRYRYNFRTGELEIAAADPSLPVFYNSKLSVGNWLDNPEYWVDAAIDELEFETTYESKLVSNLTDKILEGADITTILTEATTKLRDAGITSTEDVDELVLYITNDGQLYRQRTLPIITNLQKKYKKGQYDRDLAVKAFMYLADDGVRKYDKEFGSGQGKLFLDKQTREAIAQELRDRYEEQITEE